MRRRANASNGTPSVGLKRLGGVDETEHADADQLRDLDLRRHAVSEAAGEGAHQPDVLHHEPVARFEIRWRRRRHAHERASVPCESREPSTHRGSTGAARPGGGGDQLHHPASQAAIGARLAGVSTSARHQRPLRLHRIGHLRVAIDVTVVANASAEELLDGVRQLAEHQQPSAASRAC